MAAWANNRRCDVCDQLLGNARYWTLHKTNLICEPCHLIPDQCSLCSMPVKLGFATTSDGRHFCRRHVSQVVLTENDAVAVYRSATDELRRLARGGMELRSPRVPVNLFDTDYWSLDKNGTAGDGLHKVGFSRTTWTDNRTNHSVVLLSGQRREALAAVSAHEYTHLWIHENRPADRVIEPDTVEAICELAAWKLMQARGEKEQMARIETNTYTKGRIHDLLRIEPVIGFGGVLDWVRNGTATNFAAGGSGPAPAPKNDQSAALAVWRAATHTARPAPPDRLRLDGLLHGQNRTIALINGVSVEAGGAAEITLNGTKVRLFVDQIADDHVVVHTNGAAEPVTLTLERLRRAAVE